jgi:type VI secretion system secreted protein Hcp
VNQSAKGGFIEMAIYLQIDGVMGDATDNAHPEWIAIQSMHMSVSRHIETPTGDGKNRDKSNANVSEISLQKISDISTPDLFKQACVGQPGTKAVIHVTNGNQGPPTLEYTLSDVLISGYSVGSNGETPMESFSLNFTKIETSYTPYDTNNNPGTAVRHIYDLAKNELS